MTDLSVPNDVLQPLFSVSNSSDLKETLEFLISTSRTDDGRFSLANVLPNVLQLIQLLDHHSGCQYLLLCLKLLRNLCAGEIVNQSCFIELNGIVVLLAILRSLRLESKVDHGCIRMGLQVLANVCLAGEEHQQDIWGRFFPIEFVELAKVQSRETCDPLCMIIYTCSEGSSERFVELCCDQGLLVIAEIVRTGSVVGFGEDWLKLLISRISLEEIHFSRLFARLYCNGDLEDSRCFSSTNNCFSAEQAFLLRIVSEILNERLKELTPPNDFVVCVFGVFKRSVEHMDSFLGGKSGLPTGSAEIDILGYSLTILRDLCAQYPSPGHEEDSKDAVNSLLSYGLLDLLLGLLRDLEPPSIIKKALKQSENLQETSSNSLKSCPYKGYRRDIVAVIGNCAFWRKHVQDEIRQKNGILLLLQQCVTDEDNPFLREWGIWSMRNLLEGNAENQQAVAELELQGSVDVPELAGLGLRVEVDQNTRRAKLVNIPGK